MLLHRLRGWLGCLLFFGAVTTWAEVPVPPLKSRVTDLTATLAANQVSALEKDLENFETSTGSQLAVLLVPTTQPETIEQFSIRVVEAWKLGHKGKDDGLLLLVAKNDRKVRIEVGYGLEGIIPDAVAKRIVDETITPRFKEGDFSGGLTAGVQRLAGVIEGRKPVEEVGGATLPPADLQSLKNPARLGNVMDLTGTLDIDVARAFSDELDNFYNSGRAKPTTILIVRSTRPESIDQYAERVLFSWGETDNLDVDRSLLMVLAKDEGEAYIAAGAGLRQRILPGTAESLVADKIEPILKHGELVEAVQTSIKGVERIIDDAIRNKTFSERLIEKMDSFTGWLLLLFVVVGVGMRWLLGPLFGGLLMGGVLGAGTWFVSGAIELAVFAALAGFIFVLVGVSNWLAMGLGGLSGGGGGSSGGGGFSGGGGGFGGGGASGSW